jgi:hypothetical protein
MKLTKGKLSATEICEKMKDFVVSEEVSIESERKYNSAICLDCIKHYENKHATFTIVIDDKIEEIVVSLTYYCGDHDNIWKIEGKFKQILLDCGFGISDYVFPY